jgi:ATP-dependent helicase/nuclease subunit A
MLLGTYRDGLTREGAEHLEAVRDLCRQARDYLDTLPFAAALESIVHHTGLLSVAAGRDRGSSTRSGSLIKALAIARQLESAGLHWSEASDRLREIVNGERKDGRITLEEGAPDAVRIMTLHQAKGLQCPVVFLADPYSSYDPGPTEHAGRHDDGTAFLTAPLTAGEEFRTRVVAAPARWFESDESEERLFEEAERRRLSYVAATRAKGLLVVSRYLGQGGTLRGAGSWGLFHDGLDDAPELKRLLVSGAQGAPGAVPAVLRDFAEERREALAAATAPSYRSLAVTAGDDTGDEEVLALARSGGDSRRAGHGAPYGSAIHSLFEWAIRWRRSGFSDAAAIAKVDRLWAEWGTNVQKSEALGALAGLRGSELWGRLASTDDVLTEIDVSATEVVGAIDLAYRDAAGWHLVDFKTDVAMDEAAVAAAVDRHAGQLRAYADIWAAATGAPPASLSIYLTDTGARYAVA